MSTFREQVYMIVQRIPAGQVLTYGEVARRARHPRAARAVANLMAKNYDPAIPCHRVIRSDGGLGGYNRGGTTKKAALLAKEGYQIS